MAEPAPRIDADAVRRRQRRRSVALGVLLAALVVLFYAMTLMKYGAGAP